MTTPQRIAIIGAGPIGLEAALTFASQGHDVHIYERAEIAQSVRDWSHVTLFSPWSLNTSTQGLQALKDQGYSAPNPEVFPTGAEFLQDYLIPLSQHPSLKGRIHTQTRVTHVGREGTLKGELIGSKDRTTRPFRLLLETSQGDEQIAYTDVVLDTSGTYSSPNALGDGGIPALGEHKAHAAGKITHTIPDVLGKDRALFEGRHTLLVGAGYSAVTTLRNLHKLSEDNENTRITWLTRTGKTPYTRIEDDPLPQRDALSVFGNKVAQEDQNLATYLSYGSIHSIQSDGDSLRVTIQQRNTNAKPLTLHDIDHIVANVGFRPDTDLYRELQVHQCYASEGPMKLAAALLSASGGGGDCLQQTSMGAETLTSPEPNFFILGSKSYGRGSSFLLKLGLEQIQDVSSLLA